MGRYVKFYIRPIIPKMKANKNHKILWVDANPDLLIKEMFIQNHIDLKMAASGSEAIVLAKTFSPNLILLEVVLPELDGIETCIELRTIKSLSKTLIVFYTERNEDYSQVAAFKAGADDYIVKPTNKKVLLSRINALLRRLDNPITNLTGEDNSTIRIDRERYVIVKNGVEIVLPRKEFELLSLLFSSPRKVFTRQEISSFIWGQEMVAKNRTIDVHIRKLREKLGDGFIKTVKGIGYRVEL